MNLAIFCKFYLTGIPINQRQKSSISSHLAIQLRAFGLCCVYFFYTVAMDCRLLLPACNWLQGERGAGLSNLEITLLLLTHATGLGEPADPRPAVANSLQAIRESMPNVSNRRGLSVLPTPINIDQIPIELRKTGAPVPVWPRRHRLHKCASRYG